MTEADKIIKAIREGYFDWNLWHKVADLLERQQAEIRVLTQEIEDLEVYYVYEPEAEEKP